MALSTATISYNLADMVGADFDVSDARVWVTTNVDGGAVVDTVGNAVRLGDGMGTLASDGTGSLNVWVPGAGSNPASWQTTVHVAYAPRIDGWRPIQRDFGPFTVTGNADLADLVAEQEVPPTYVDGVVATLQNMIDQGLKGPAGPAGPAGANGGSDASTADNVTNGSATKSAVRRRVGERGQFYNFTGVSMRKFRTAQARSAAGGTPVTVIGKGNSIMQSVISAPFNTNSWMSRLQKYVERRYGYSGEFITLMDVGGQDTRYSKTGTWTTLASKGWVASRAATTVTAGSTATFVGKCDRMTVYYLLTADAGTFSYSLNGAGAVNVNANGAEAIGSFTVTPTMSDTNSLVITAPTDNTRLTILGVDMRVGSTGGYRFIKAAYTGQKTQNFTGATAPGDPLNVARNLLPADLHIIDLITNDYGTGTVLPLSVFEANMRILIASAQETGSCIIDVGPATRVRVGPDGAADTPDDIPLTTSPTMAEFVDLTYRLADELECGVINMQERWGTWAQADASGMMYDYYHPSDRGNWDYALAHFEAVFQHTPGRDPISTDVPNVFTSTQTVGHPSATSSRVRVGSGDVVTDYTTTPALASVLASTTGALILAGKSGQAIQLWSDILLIAGKKFNGQNANVPAVDINVGFLRLAGVATGSRPAAATAGKGAQHFDTTLNRPIWSTGTAWVDAMGNTI